jgi:hypothetical protein
MQHDEEAEDRYTREMEFRLRDICESKDERKKYEIYARAQAWSGGL